MEPVLDFKKNKSAHLVDTVLDLKIYSLILSYIYKKTDLFNFTKII